MPDIEQHAAAQKKTEPADPLAVLDEIANAEEALTFHRAVLSNSPGDAAQSSPRVPRFTPGSGLKSAVKGR